MLCIAAFLVLLVLAAVSAKYRRLLGTAWRCVTRRVTFRPCDTSFREDVKNSMLAPLAVRAPRLVKPASIAIEVTAWIMVLSLVVSLYIVGKSGLNLFVYGTCNPQDTQACSLSAGACSIDAGADDFGSALGKGDVIGAFAAEFRSLGKSFDALPSRLKDWDAREYLPEAASYAGGYREGLPVAVEVIDPGCRFCAELFRNIQSAGFADGQNLAYIPYPIGPDAAPKFTNSPLITDYLTAIRLTEEGDVPRAGGTDWRILAHIFTGERADGVAWQTWFNEQASAQEAETQLQDWLAESGYDASRIQEVARLAASDEVHEIVAAGKRVVEEEIRTATVPTLIADGALHPGVVSVDQLRGMR